jgi:hypothetical protein
MGLTTLPCKKKIVEKPPRNSARFCGGAQGLSWAVEPRKERRITQDILLQRQTQDFGCKFSGILQRGKASGIAF